jgi:protein-S-isoprenylcysteine O-methyltransferase Ste14
VDTHVRVVGVLYLGLGVLGLLCAGLMLIGFGGVAGIISSTADSEDAAIAIPILSLVGTFAMIFIAAFSLPAVISGVGLLYFKSWARIVGIVLSAIALLGFPWGTILGVYALWVLFNKQTEQLFARSAIRS